ncbi:MAG: hypothetical protein FJZ43_02280 [Candidatus Staskawiczbacteria bacterium]|nr:hypothetical protein [Candidatus Staskawiczbacteria bacterium]
MKKNPDNLSTVNLPEARKDNIGIEKKIEIRREKLKAKLGKKKPIMPKVKINTNDDSSEEESKRNEMSDDERREEEDLKKEKKIEVEPPNFNESASEEEIKRQEEKEKITVENDLKKAFEYEKAQSDVERVRGEAQEKDLDQMIEKAKDIDEKIKQEEQKLDLLKKEIEALEIEAESKPDLSIEKAQIESQIEEKEKEIELVMKELARLEGDLNQFKYYQKNMESAQGARKFAKKIIDYDGKVGNVGNVVRGVAGYALAETIKTVWGIISITANKAWEEISKLTGAGGFWEDTKRMFKKFWGSKEGSGK